MRHARACSHAVLAFLLVACATSTPGLPDESLRRSLARIYTRPCTSAPAIVVPGRQTAARAAATAGKVAAGVVLGAIVGFYAIGSASPRPSGTLGDAATGAAMLAGAGGGAVIGGATMASGTDAAERRRQQRLDRAGRVLEQSKLPRSLHEAVSRAIAACPARTRPPAGSGNAAALRIEVEELGIASRGSRLAAFVRIEVRLEDLEGRLLHCIRRDYRGPWRDDTEMERDGFAALHGDLRAAELWLAESVADDLLRVVPAGAVSGGAP